MNVFRPHFFLIALIVIAMVAAIFTGCGSRPSSKNAYAPTSGNIYVGERTTSRDRNVSADAGKAATHYDNGQKAMQDGRLNEAVHEFTAARNEQPQEGKYDDALKTAQAVSGLKDARANVSVGENNLMRQQSPVSGEVREVYSGPAELHSVIISGDKPTANTVVSTQPLIPLLARNLGKGADNEKLGTASRRHDDDRPLPEDLVTLREIYLFAPPMPVAMRQRSPLMSIARLTMWCAVT